MEILENWHEERLVRVRIGRVVGLGEVRNGIVVIFVLYFKERGLQRFLFAISRLKERRRGQGRRVGLEGGQATVHISFVLQSMTHGTHSTEQPREVSLGSELN